MGNKGVGGKDRKPNSNKCFPKKHLNQNPYKYYFTHVSNMLLNRNQLIVLSEFSQDYSKRVYGRDIAKKHKLNQKTVSNILLKLEKENILKFETQGKNKYYFLNRFNPNISEIIKLIEINKKITFLNKHKRFIELFKELEKRTNGTLIIFGSYAKGSEHEDSDLDLFALGNIQEVKDLEKMYNLKINILKSKKIDKEETIFKEIINNHIILKGEDDFINKIKW